MNLSNEQIAEVFERYRANFSTLSLNIYSSTSREDLLLLRWWFYLSESGDLAKITQPDSRRLSSFLQIFQPPTVTFYGISPFGEIDFVAWFKEPSGNSIFAGIWTHPSIRSTKRLLYIIQDVYSLVFEFYNSILGITWQPELLQLHTKIGYAITGNFKDFMGQPIVWLTQLTRDEFYNSRLYQLGRK